MRQFVLAFVAAAIVFLSLDAVWLTIMSSRLYRPAIGHVQPCATAGQRYFKVPRDFSWPM